MKEILKELMHILSQGKVMEGAELNRVTKKKMTELLPALRILHNNNLIAVHPNTSLISEEHAEEAFFAATTKLIHISHLPSKSFDDYAYTMAT